MEKISPQDFSSFLAKYSEKSADDVLDLLKNIQGDVNIDEMTLIAMVRWQKRDPSNFDRNILPLTKFPWLQFFELEFTWTRSRTCFDPIITLLLRTGVISIEDAIPRCTVFKALVRVAKDLESAKIGDFKLETLSQAIVKSNCTKKTVKINELQHLRQLRLLNPRKPTYEAAFSCIDTTRTYLIKYFLDVPGLASYLRKGENLLVCARSHVRSWWFKYFTKADIRQLILNSAKWFDGFVWTKNSTLYPSVLLEVFKEHITKGELSEAKLNSALSPILGKNSDRFIYWHDPSEYSALVSLPNYAKPQRESISTHTSTVSLPLGFKSNSNFPIEQLPLELVFLICQDLSSKDVASLCLASKSFVILGREALYMFLFKRQYTVLHDDLIAHGQPILLDHLSSLNKRRSNWKRGKFKVTYHKWKSCDEYQRTLMKAIDDNWAVALTHYHVMLWNCHDHQKYLLPSTCYAPYTTCEILDSQPDRLPTLVEGSYSFMTLFIDGKKKQYNLKDLLGLEQTSSRYHTPIERDKVLTGKTPLVWSVELEQMIASVGTSDVNAAKYNPLTGMTVMNHTEDMKEYSFIDKNFQVVLQASHRDYSTFLHQSLHWINEHQFVHVTLRDSLYIDLRMMKPYSIEEHLLSEPICPFYGSSLALAANPKKSIATVWDLSNRLWESIVVLPEDVLDTPVCNSRYAVFATPDSSKLCVLDWQ